MNKKSIFISGIAVLAVVVGGAIFYSYSISTADKDMEKEPVVSDPLARADPKNISYNVAGESITLVDGKYERAITPETQARKTISIFGEPTTGDVDADGDLDAAMYLTHNEGGSGTFYYLVLAINTNGVYTGTNAMLLGDRIAPQNIDFVEGRFVANYSERNAGEPFTTPPSRGKSLWVHYDPKTNEVGELVRDFEGEADPSRMTLGGHEWKWVRTTRNNMSVVTPKQKDAFILSFKKDGVFTLATDCNNVGGRYVLDKDILNFDSIVATEMFCENSQEGEFASMLNDVATYRFTSKGELIFELEDKKGVVTFR